VTSNISRSASHCAESMQLMDDLAQLDFSDSSDYSTTDFSTGAAVQLSVTHLQNLSSARQKNLLRYWISQHGFQTPSTSQLRQILTDLVSGAEASGRINFGSAQIARYQQALFIGARDSFEPLADFEYQWNDSSLPLHITELSWCLDISLQPNLKAYTGLPLIVRNRRGGERWRADSAEHSVSVKSLLQHRRIPPWQRSRIVFVFSDDRLVDICGPGFVL